MEKVVEGKQYQSKSNNEFVVTVLFVSKKFAVYETESGENMSFTTDFINNFEEVPEEKYLLTFNEIADIWRNNELVGREKLKNKIYKGKS